MASRSLISPVRFFFQETRIRLDRRRELKKFIVSIFKKEGRILESLNIIFCTDPILLQINREFLQHDFFTDIITFDLSVSSQVSGEIYISVDRIKENASTLDLAFSHELHRVIIHGALHLCGYTDKTGRNKGEMRKMEDKYLAKYGFR